MHRLLAYKKVALAGGVTLLAVGGAVMLWPNNAKTPTQIPENPTGEINYNPPTETEKAETEQHKDDIAKQQTQTPQTSNNGNSIVVTITSATVDDASVQIASYVSGIIEDGGVCTITLQQGANKVSRNVSGMANATTTNCEYTTFNRSDFTAPGIWKLSVSYSSPKAQGTSAEKEVKL